MSLVYNIDHIYISYSIMNRKNSCLYMRLEGVLFCRQIVVVSLSGGGGGGEC